MANTLQGAEETAKVLLVEDDPIQVRIINMMLARHHVDLIAAENYDDAIVLAHQSKPNVILVDLRLSSSSGIEVIRTLKADSELERIPVIVMTAVSHSQTIKQAYEAGCDLFLTKPVRPNELLDGIRSLKAAG